MEEIHFGDIWYVKGQNTMGHEQSGDRPWIIVSNDIHNNHSPMISAVPLTTRLDKKSLPTHCEIISSYQPSIALCEQVRQINKSDLTNMIGHCHNFEMRNVKICLMIQFNMI